MTDDQIKELESEISRRYYTAQFASKADDARFYQALSTLLQERQRPKEEPEPFAKIAEEPQAVGYWEFTVNVFMDGMHRARSALSIQGNGEREG
jgi:hypothetical protein